MYFQVLAKNLVATTSGTSTSGKVASSGRPDSHFPKAAFAGTFALAARVGGSLSVNTQLNRRAAAALALFESVTFEDERLMWVHLED